MDVDAYLARIRYSGPRAPTAETLRRLHRAHSLTVPFENLDIHRGQRIVLDEPNLFTKIVRHRRGGFCYELNALFAALLRALGFDVTLLSARVYLDGRLGPEFDHMVLLVRLTERWLADVGYGALFVEPLRLDAAGAQVQRGVAFRITRQGDIRTLSVRGAGTGRESIYRFDLVPREIPDYVRMCRWHQTSPRSWHTQNRVCTRATPSGRVTLYGMKLTVRTKRARREQLLSTDAQYAAALRTHFGVKLS